MSDDITFEQMDLSEKDKVLSFLKTAYSDNPRQSDPEFWDWHFVRQPGSRAGQISIWLAKSGDRIAGQLATIPVTAEGEGPREHLSAADIREMSASGVEFGSHSMNHKLFDRIEDAEIEQEIVESKSYIENLLQKPCGVFAYPAGFFTDFARDAVKRAGYHAAFSTVYGPADNSDRFALNRTEVLRRDGLPFRFPRKIRAIFAG